MASTRLGVVGGGGSAAGAAGRDLDVVVFGTGYAAHRVAERAACAGGCESELRIGLAGRSLAKVDELRECAALAAAGQGEVSSTGTGNKVSEWPGMAADVTNPPSLVAMAGRCRCVINCVGPYMEFGEAVIKACVEAGTNVVDLSGEAEWIEEMMERYDEAARRAGVLVISAAGWDSVPSDGLAWLLRSQLSPDERGSADTHVTVQTLMYMGQRKSLWGAFGGLGAGTLKTILLGWHTGKGIDYLSDPQPVAADQRLLSQASDPSVEYFGDFGLYGVRSELFSDSLVVRASNKRLGEQERGQDLDLDLDLVNVDVNVKRSAPSGRGCLFEYNHYFAAPARPIAYGVALLLWALPKLLRFRLVFRLLMLFFRSGNGPSVQGRQNARASLHGVLKVYDARTRTLQRTVRAVADVEHDPNDVTAMVLLRSAHLLAREQHTLGIQAGCVTTAAAFQDKILHVLEPATVPRIVS